MSEKTNAKIKEMLNIRVVIVVSVCVFMFGAILGFLTGDGPVEEASVSTPVVATPNSGQEGQGGQAKSNTKTPQSDEAKELKTLEAELEKLVKDKYPTVELSFAIKNLDTGVSVVHNSKKLNSASVIKLFIAGTVYSGIEDGTYELSDERAQDLDIMITESDNEASCNFIDDFGGTNPETRKVEATNKINEFIKKIGYANTEINRKMHNTTPPGGPTGFENYTSVEDVVMLLESIYNKSLFEEPHNTDFLNLLKNQKRRTKIPAKIVEKYPDVTVANKTGELSQVENDVAIITSDKFNIIFAVMINEIPLKEDGSTDYPLKEKVQETIADMGLKVVEYYSSKQ